MKKILKISVLIISVSLFFSGCKTDWKPQKLNIIPKPEKIWIIPGHFTLTQNSRIIYGNGDSIENEADYLKTQLNNQGKLNLNKLTLSSARSIKKDIILRLIKVQNLGKEGYRLKVTKNNVSILANTPAGIFYGIQSFFQLLPVDFFIKHNLQKKWNIQNVNIIDKPRFSYRGMHLDVGRHFFPPKFIKKYIDMLAMYKFNTFHWHLTDDQGWRIEIKKYPKLTEIGAWRDSTVIGHCCNPPLKYDGKRYGGFYTQNQIHDIVKYASKRHITIIPEIEMPGHALAALASYPELACTPGPFHVATRWGVFKDIYCPTEKTFLFLKNVLTEIMELFPGKYIHIGGDEVPKERWEKSFFCQKLMKKENLKNENELQSWFIKRIDKFLNAHGRKLIGWDEILEGGLSPGATVMSWRGTQGGIEAVKKNHDVIMTPGTYCYFDHYQADPDFQPLAIGGFLTLKKVYSYNPVPKNFSKTEAKYILGAQGNVWTEYMQTQKQVEYMVLPRMAALSEVVWTPLKKKNWPNFQRRIYNHFKRYKALKYNYCKGSYKVNIKTVADSSGENYTVSFSSEIYKPFIRYTLNGSIPDTTSSPYKKPFIVKKGNIIKAAVFVNGKLMEKPSEVKL